MATCVGCKREIRDQPRTFRLKIVDESPEILERAKDLGFTSREWKQNGDLEGSFHKQCFEVAALVWQAAFLTRRFSPRK